VIRLVLVRTNRDITDAVGSAVVVCYAVATQRISSEPDRPE